jgi:hypothetical protein
MSKIVGVFYQQVNREIHSVRIIKIKRNYTIQAILENENEQRGNHKIFNKINFKPAKTKVLLSALK